MRRAHRIAAFFILTGAGVACGLDLTGAAIPTGEPDAGGEAALPPPSNPDDTGAFDSGCGDTQNDPSNCGDCARDCHGATCSDGVCTPEVLMTGLNGPFAVAIDPETGRVYVAENSGGRIFRGPELDAGSAGVSKELVFDTQGGPMALAIAKGRLFWTEQQLVRSVQTDGGGTAGKIDNDGGTALVLGSKDAFFNDPDNGKVFSHSILSDDPSVQLGSDEKKSVGIDINAESVFWTLKDDAGKIRRWNRDALPDAAVTIVADEAFPEAIAVGSLRVFWTTPSAIRYLELDGGTDASTLYGGESTPRSIVRDSRIARLYWFENGRRTLRRGDTDGSKVITIAKGVDEDDMLPLTTAIAVDQTYVYWVSSKNGTLSRTPK